MAKKSQWNFYISMAMCCHIAFSVPAARTWQKDRCGSTGEAGSYDRRAGEAGAEAPGQVPGKIGQACEPLQGGQVGAGCSGLPTAPPSAPLQLRRGPAARWPADFSEASRSSCLVCRPPAVAAAASACCPLQKHCRPCQLCQHRHRDPRCLLWKVCSAPDPTQSPSPRPAPPGTAAPRTRASPAAGSLACALVQHYTR